MKHSLLLLLLIIANISLAAINLNAGSSLNLFVASMCIVAACVGIVTLIHKHS